MGRPALTPRRSRTRSNCGKRSIAPQMWKPSAHRINQQKEDGRKRQYAARLPKAMSGTACQADSRFVPPLTPQAGGCMHVQHDRHSCRLTVPSGFFPSAVKWPWPTFRPCKAFSAGVHALLCRPQPMLRHALFPCTASYNAQAPSHSILLPTILSPCPVETPARRTRVPHPRAARSTCRTCP